jgi:hypothetical protein
MSDIVKRLRDEGATPTQLDDWALEAADEIERLTDLLAWSYSKLHSRSFNKLEDALKLDELKLFLEHGI